jgi:hypothetical protein
MIMEWLIKYSVQNLLNGPAMACGTVKVNAHTKPSAIRRAREVARERYPYDKYWGAIQIDSAIVL